MTETLETASRGGVFISHVHEDEPIATAFTTLIRDLTAGAVDAYSSSAKSDGGIKYGTEWFQWIKASIESADHVVALLTPNSLERPWILFEAGLGKAQDPGTVFGLAIGVPLADASVGPFAIFHNSASDKASVVKLCRQLIEHARVNPRDQVIEAMVDEFLASIASVSMDAKESPEDTRSASILQAVEDLKFMIRTTDRDPAPPRPTRLTRADLDPFLHLLNPYGDDLHPAAKMRLLADLAARAGLDYVAAALRAVESTAHHPRRGEFDTSAATRVAYEVVANTQPVSPASGNLLSTARTLLDNWAHDIHRAAHLDTRAGWEQDAPRPAEPGADTDEV